MFFSNYRPQSNLVPFLVSSLVKVITSNCIWSTNLRVDLISGYTISKMTMLTQILLWKWKCIIHLIQFIWYELSSFLIIYITLYLFLRAGSIVTVAKLLELNSWWAGIFSFLQFPDQFWGPHNLPSNVYCVLPWNNAARALSLQLTWV